MRDLIDNIQDKEFRNYVENRIRLSTGNLDYSFPTVFPILYHYKGLKSYVVDNIINKQVSLSPVGSFNDTYDSTTGVCQSYDHYESITRKELESIDQRARDLSLDLPTISNEQAIKQATRNRIIKARFVHNLPDNIGLKASCFSSENNSILKTSFAQMCCQTYNLLVI